MQITGESHQEHVHKFNRSKEEIQVISVHVSFRTDLSTNRSASLISLAFSVSSFRGCSTTSPFLMMMQFQVRRSSNGTNHAAKLSRDIAARNATSVQLTRSRPEARAASSVREASVSSADICHSVSCTSTRTPFPAPGLQSLKLVKGSP